MQFPILGLILWWTYNVPCIYATESLLASLLGSRGDDIGLILQHASFQHLCDVIYIRLIQTNKPVTRLLRILPR